MADGGDSSVILVSGEDFHRINRIPLIDGSATGKGDSPDAAYYDAANRLYYIGNGGVSANLPDSTISIFSADQGKLLEEKFSVPGNNVESIGIDNLHHRLYVNIRDKQEVGVYGLNTKQLITPWTAPTLKANTALLVDSKDQRIFVAGRKPGLLYVFDQNGNVVSEKPCADINDDMSYDPASKRIYVSGTQGLSVFHQDSPEQLHRDPSAAHQRRQDLVSVSRAQAVLRRPPEERDRRRRVAGLSRQSLNQCASSLGRTARAGRPRYFQSTSHSYCLRSPGLPGGPTAPMSKSSAGVAA